MRRLALGLMFSLATSASAHAAPQEREVATLDVEGKVSLSLLRVRQSDGGLKLRLALTQKGGKKATSVTVYEGGADDDGPTDKSFRGATMEAFALPGGKHGARIDFEFMVPGSKKHRQIDTYLVSLDGAPRLVLDVTTHRERDRDKICHEIEDTALVLEKSGKLIARSVSALDSELNDDDLPIDKNCKGKRPSGQVTYKFDGETFLQIDPPVAAKKKPATESDDD